MRRWRYEHQGNLWRGGSGIRCCGRFFCCSLLLFLFFLISIVLSLLLVRWIACLAAYILTASLVGQTTERRGRQCCARVRWECRKFNHAIVTTVCSPHAVPGTERWNYHQLGGAYLVRRIFHGFYAACSTLDARVDNPNYFSVKFDSIDADVSTARLRLGVLALSI